ncbi:hypothetical protein E2C01_001254 [Portunus trituberculatus]|uniref:Uncharacterized protein n=1 Tax=Portunus trituberculatus TaxID=210409 RepID=A0A5B7CIU8_PORTR|nr:hypothetical protein [Portunus trituberculatus]
MVQYFPTATRTGVSSRSSHASPPLTNPPASIASPLCRPVIRYQNRTMVAAEKERPELCL